MSNTTTNTTNPPPPPTKTRELTTATIKSPPFAYLHLSASSSTTTLDALQVRSYCTSACRQFLGATGAAIPVDILSVPSGSGGGDAWVRVPRADLGAFAGAITAYGGSSSDAGGVMVLRVKACGDWLGSLVGGEGEERVWGSSS
ncbi:hypothetical protein QBC39DRAFT_297657 [Podospora conica]|nr:hypothetical protein QBC39DRAFT_297657 [Schizothecium conicum]